MTMGKQTSRSLHDLLARWQAVTTGTKLPQPPDYNGPDIPLTALVEHTNQVRPGACFVARVRETSDGHPFIPQAIANGAALILGQHDPAGLPFTIPASVTYLQVPDSSLAEAWLAAAWENFPGRELTIVGITGTDGKTTTANILHAILQAAGWPTGLLSTLRAVIGGREETLALHVTTPEAPVVQRYLRRMVQAGISHCILETTSHSLAQNRVAAIPFDVAVVTNITHEHLDYHGSWDAYLAAKMRLFTALQETGWGTKSVEEPVNKTAILNQDDQSYGPLSALARPHQITYSLEKPAGVRAGNIQFGSDGTTFTLHLPDGPPLVNIQAHLPGDFNLYNMLAAAGAAYALAIPPEAIHAGLEQVRALTGRMQSIVEGQPFQVVVDFAHTPNGLAKAIAAAKRMTNGRIITVFGSAGKRDVAKRTIMAEISGREADLTVLTAEDPRTESLDDILAAMAVGCVSVGGAEEKTFWRVQDRGRAIYFALGLARPGDLVLVCGKGHEQSMCFGPTEYPWDDVQATQTALRAFLSGEPMPDLGLPTF
jgi:UDP-N-acetylmuramoyl-L-alanyl-D-glutamate--2,6-diaminopimelate ligase